MTTAQSSDAPRTPPSDQPSLTGSNRRTLVAIFRHPSAHNLEWGDVVALFEKIGDIEQKANSEFAIEVAGVRHRMHKPHTKDLTGPEVIELRHFLAQAGWSAEASP